LREAVDKKVSEQLILMETCPISGLSLVEANRSSATIGQRLDWSSAAGMGVVDGRWTREHWVRGLWRASTAARLQTIVSRSLNQKLKAGRLAAMEQTPSRDLELWNLFSWLEDRDLLPEVAEKFGLSAPSTAQIFYWGSNDRYEFPVGISQVLRGRFQESPSTHGEPELMLTTETDLLFLVANPLPHGLGNIDKYLQTAGAWFTNQKPDLANDAHVKGLFRLWATGATIGERAGKQFSLGLISDFVSADQLPANWQKALSNKGRFLSVALSEARQLDSAVELFPSELTCWQQPVPNFDLVGA
jgi:hypothetical protein